MKDKGYNKPEESEEFIFLIIIWSVMFISMWSMMFYFAR
jgi:hypothetical protein